MVGVDMGEWVTAVSDALAEFDDEAVPVALALSRGEPSADGISKQDFCSEVEYFLECGFLVDVLSIDHSPGREEHLLEFRIPEPS